MGAQAHGISTHKVDDLVKALGADTKSELFQICAGLDEEVVQFRDRTLTAQDSPYVFLDDTYCNQGWAPDGVPGDHRRGRPEVLGFDVGDSEYGAGPASCSRSRPATLVG